MEVEEDYYNYLDNKNNEIYISKETLSKKKLKKTEARIKNDLIEFENKRITLKRYKIYLDKYYFEDNIISLKVLIDKYFLIKFIFSEDYPFDPPELIYLEGKKFNFFDDNNKLKLDCLTKEKWSAVLSINSILFQLELLLFNFEQKLFNIDQYKTTKLFYCYIDDNRYLLSDDNNLNDLSVRLNKIKI